MSTFALKSMAGFIAVAIAAVALPSQAQEPQAKTTKDDALKAIALFRTDPVSDQGRAAAAILVRFAKDSPDVEVVASPSLQPWMAVKPAPKESAVLLVAYIAGSVRSQLESGKTKNDAVAGIEQVIETYQKLQQSAPGFRLEAVEKLVDLKKQGKLKEYLESQ